MVGEVGGRRTIRLAHYREEDRIVKDFDRAAVVPDLRAELPEHNIHRARRAVAARARDAEDLLTLLRMLGLLDDPHAKPGTKR